MRLEGLPIMGFRLFIVLWRRKGHCDECRKARSEAIEFVSPESPHLMRDYAEWIGRLFEIASVSRVAELLGQDETTMWRLDFNRLSRMLFEYQIPKVRRISVDEVYAYKKARNQENRDQRFFTVITDLETRRVLWVADGRTEAALSEFFKLIGQAACRRIEVVAADQHDDYARAIRRYCPKATLVWDRFHVMQNFEKVLNEERKRIHEKFRKHNPKKELTRGRYRFLFLKKESRRTLHEQTHINEAIHNNKSLFRLELIKERMLGFFDQPDEYQARLAFHDVGQWILQGKFPFLKRWWFSMNENWAQLANYFKYRVTSALSEGVNNVIKTLKRRAYGYKNMEYFKLKIMQVCGFLNSRYLLTLRTQTYT
jgi:transposase